MRAAIALTPLPSWSRRCSEVMLARRLVILPQRLLLMLISGMVIVGLTIAAGFVWLSARRLRRRPVLLEADE